MARTTPGNFVPLDVNYPRDPAIRRAGPDAELLYVRGLAYAKGARSKGLIPDYDLTVVAVGLRAVQRSVKALVRENLWTEMSGGWRIRSWDPWNEVDDSRSESQSEGGRRGNHERWHVTRSVVDPDCEWCTESPPDIGTRSVPDIAPDSDSESQGKGREGKKETSADADPTPRPDVEALCEHLHRRVTANGVRASVTGKWRDSARLLLDRDQRPLAEAHTLIDWCQDSEFWRANVQAMPKFREKYDTLRLQAKSARNGLRPVTDSVPNVRRDIPPWEDFG